MIISFVIIWHCLWSPICCMRVLWLLFAESGLWGPQWCSTEFIFSNNKKQEACIRERSGDSGYLCCQQIDSGSNWNCNSEWNFFFFSINLLMCVYLIYHHSVKKTVFCNKELIFMLFLVVLYFNSHRLLHFFLSISFFSSEVSCIMFEECDWCLKEDYDCPDSLLERVIWKAVTGWMSEVHITCLTSFLGDRVVKQWGLLTQSFVGVKSQRKQWILADFL